MGTFHDNHGEFHGITIAVYFHTGAVAIGRCHEANDQQITMYDVDIHDPNQTDIPQEQWLEQATKWGVFPKVKNAAFPACEVKHFLKLSDLTSTPAAS
ncbi:MAG: hypothetical protein ACYTGQ_08195 [Planctomycetota bacterium]|jgi:hypothetical protein